MRRIQDEELPFMLYADAEGRIYEHPDYRMAGNWGPRQAPIKGDDLVPLPEFSRLFYLPDCPAVGLDPTTGQYRQARLGGSPCNAVAAFLEPGFVRTHLPAAHFGTKSYVLPSWAYTAVGFKDDTYWASGFRVESNPKWDPENYDDRDLMPAIERYAVNHGGGPLLEHLVGCAVENHCFAAKNLFLERWEAPLPVSRHCNAECLGCLSLQPDVSCKASHERIDFRPSRDEIVALAVNHLENAEEPIVSFGQGCEGEPLLEHRLIRDSIKEMRKRTPKGTINLNTNGSMPERIREIARSGLDSIRISLNSARRELYDAYYRPKSYDFSDVEAALSLSKEMGLYTMINLLVFPGVSDREEEMDALMRLVRHTGIHFIHMKNLCIDPALYLQKMPPARGGVVGLKAMSASLRREFTDLRLGYFNQPVK